MGSKWSQGLISGMTYGPCGWSRGGEQSTQLCLLELVMVLRRDLQCVLSCKQEITM